MSLVSSVSHEMMNRCEIERNPISLAAVRALGDAHLKCCMQMYYALALITKGSVRTLIRSVEETNGAEAWRLIHSRYPPDTQNRQYALMEKIMTPAKPRCDHADGFESGLRSWELDVGEWERASGIALADAVKYTVIMNMAQIFLRKSLQLGTYANSTSRNFGANPTASSGNGTSADDDRMQVRERAEIKPTSERKIARPTRVLQTSTRARIVANLDIWRKTAGFPVEERMTIPPTEILAKARVKTQVKEKANTWTLSKRNNFSLLKQLQPCRILRKDPSVVGELWCISSVDPWIMGVTLNSVSSTRRQVGAEYLLLDSGAQLHACPLTYPGQKIPLPDPGIHTASGARLQHDGGRLVTYTLPEGRTIRVLFHACAVQKPILSLGRLAQQVYWSDLRADSGTLFFPDKTQTKHSHTQLHKEESLFFVKGTMVAPLTTAGVSDEVAQEIQMPVGPQMLEDVEEPRPARPATLRDPGTPDQIVMEQHNLTHFPSQPWCKMCVESRGHDSPHREQSKIDAVVLQLQFDYGYMGDGGTSTDGVLPRGNRHLFWSHPRDDGTGLQEDGHALRCRNNSQVGA